MCVCVCVCVCICVCIYIYIYITVKWIFKNVKTLIKINTGTTRNKCSNCLLLGIGCWPGWVAIQEWELVDGYILRGNHPKGVLY